MKECHTLVMSDIHLGARICRTQKVLTVLNSIKCKRLIINGDLFDSNTTNTFTRDHWEIIAHLALIAEKIPVTLVGGNHGRKLDILAQKMGIEIVESYVFNVGKKKFLLIHGDEFDFFIKKMPMTTKIFTTIYYFIQYLGGKRQTTSMVLKKLSKRILRISSRQQRLALKHGKSHHANVIICSHTHIPHINNTGEVLFINSGSFCDKQSTYITINDTGVTTLQVI